MSLFETVAIQQKDSLQLRIDLPLTGTWYPLGFRIDIATNSHHVIEAAEESWGHYRPEYERRPIRLRVIVQPQGELCGEPTHRAWDNLYSIVSDRHNFGMFDRATLAASIYVSEQTAADHVRLRWFYVESPAYMLLGQHYVVPVHAACVGQGEQGVLLCGAPAAGKSTLSYACARAGWTFASDDCIFLLADSPDRIAIGQHRKVRFRPEALKLFPEIEGYMSQARPTGKPSIEVPTDRLPIRTAARLPIRAIVFLERAEGATPSIKKVMSDDAVATMQSHLPSYGDEVDSMHARTLRQLATVPAYRMQYESLEDGIRLLNSLLVP